MDNFTVLSIPEISNERQIWLIRTNGGLYYNDFTTNKYVALGWDAVSVDLLLNSSISNDAKKEKINELYPDEKSIAASTLCSFAIISSVSLR